MSGGHCCQKTQTTLKCCPINGVKGKWIQIITLKSLLKSSALAVLEPDTTYFFCATSDCPVVYFNDRGQTFTPEQVKVPVFQKNEGDFVPICYCFSWTRDRIRQEIEQMGSSRAEYSILNHVKVGRCGCEVNNPQGSCCLTNVRTFVRSCLEA